MGTTAIYAVGSDNKSPRIRCGSVLKDTLLTEYMQKVASARDKINATDRKIGLHGLSEK